MEMEGESPEKTARENKKVSCNMECDGNVSSSVPDRRKTLKPMMEKKRRARINASLEELKRFLLDVIKKEGLRHNKMEKADILELTVKHLRHLQQAKPSGSGLKNGDDTYLQGFGECVTMVNNFLKSNLGLDPTVQARLLDHLSCCMNKRSLKMINSSGRPSLATNTSKEEAPLAFKKHTFVAMEPNHEINPTKAEITSGEDSNRILPSTDMCITSVHKQSERSISNSSVGVVNNTGTSQNLNDKNSVLLNSISPVYVTNNGQFCNSREHTNNINHIVANGQLSNFAYVIPLPIIPGSYIPNLVSSTCVPKYFLTVPTSQNPQLFEQDDKLLSTPRTQEVSSSVTDKSFTSPCSSTSTPPVTSSKSLNCPKACSWGTLNFVHPASSCSVSVSPTNTSNDSSAFSPSSSVIQNNSENQIVNRQEGNGGTTWRPWS